MLTSKDISELQERIWSELSRIDETFGKFQGPSVEEEKSYWHGMLIKLDDMKETI